MHSCLLLSRCLNQCQVLIIHPLILFINVFFHIYFTMNLYPMSELISFWYFPLIQPCLNKWTKTMSLQREPFLKMFYTINLFPLLPLSRQPGVVVTGYRYMKPMRRGVPKAQFHKVFKQKTLLSKFDRNGI